MGCCSTPCCGCRCCNATKGNRTCWSLVLFVFASLILVGGILTGSAGKKVQTNLKCVIDGFNDLIEESAASGLAGGADVANDVDQSTLDTLDTLVSQMEIGTTVPGLVVAFFAYLAVVAVCVYNFMGTECCVPTAKCFLGLGYILIALCGAFFLLIAALGVASGLSNTQTQWDENIGDVCLDSHTELTNQLQNAVVNLATCQSNLGSACASYAADVAAATKQLATFGGMCLCIADTLDELTAFRVPGIIGVLGCFFGWWFQMGLCSTVGCCAPLNKVVPMDA